MANENIIEINHTEVIETEETKKVTFWDKTKAFGKKHGKKIVAGAAVVGGAVLATLLFKNREDDLVDEEVESEWTSNDEPTESEE